MSTNISAAIFKINHSPKLFEAVQENIFRASVVRSAYAIKIVLYRLSTSNPVLKPHQSSAIANFKNEIHKVGIGEDDLVVLHLSSEYTLTNVGPDTKDITINFGIERYFPSVSAKICCIDQASVNGVNLIAEPLSEPSKKNPSMVTHSVNTKIAPGQNVRVTYSCFAVRYLDDEEIWLNRQIANDMKLTLIDCTNKKLHLEIHGYSFNPVGGPHITNWDSHETELVKELDLVLPYQSAVAKWGLRKSEDEQPSGVPAPSGVATVVPVSTSS